MKKTFYRLAAAVLALACIASPLRALERPITVEDIVKLEAFGRVSVAPDGRWAVYEKRDDYDTIPNYDHVQRAPWTIMDLWRVDLRAADPRPERLLPDEPLGLQRGDWSPDGRRLTVFRFRGDIYELGIVEVATRAVVWTGLTPEIPLKGAPVIWTSNDQLAAAVRPAGDLPLILQHFYEPKKRIAEAWARTSSGRERSRTVIEADKGVVRSEEPAAPQDLVLIEAASGQVRRTLMSAHLTDLVLSPDGRRLAVLASGEAMPLLTPMVQFDEPFRQRLTLIDLETGRSGRLDQVFDVAPQLLRWSPDSRALLAWMRGDDQAWSEGGLVSVDVAGRTRSWPSAVRPGPDIDILRGVRADWLDGAPILYGRAPGEDRADWHAIGVSPSVNLTAGLEAPPAVLMTADRGALTLFADGRQWAVEPGGVRPLGDPDLRLRWARILDPERPRRQGQEAERRAWSPALGSKGETLILAATGEAEVAGPPSGPASMRVVGAGPGAVLALEQKELVETLVLRRGDESRPLDAVNQDRADVVLAPTIPLIHNNAFGQPTQSSLLLPKGPIKGLFVPIYPGYVDDGGWYGPLFLTYNIRSAVMAGLGYAVLSPSIPADLPGTRDHAFYEESIGLAVDAAFAAYPELPRNRTAIFGHSMGGYVGLILATRTDRYQTYILSSSAGDMIGKWGEFDPTSRILTEVAPVSLRNHQGWIEIGQGEIGATPWSDPVKLAAESPYLHADRIRNPVMLITADQDFIGTSQSERTFSALARLGVRTRMTTYWGEYHARWSPANIRDQYEQILEWLDETLPPETEGKGAQAGAPRP